MPHYRLHTPDQTIDLGDFDNAQEALESAVSSQSEMLPVDGSLELQIGDDWHAVDIEGDMP
ncbi:hypothetical protein AB0331_12325 [Dietzia maris]|jgi:hypothetical protein|uniref:hypothetical protein n=1 Tax=Dietzia maris TaxID=37915 RepID=UPI00344C6832